MRATSVNSMRHRIMAPATRVFCRLGFKAKAIVITGTFLIPIILLGTSFWTTAQQRITFTQQELRGAGVLASLVPLYQGVIETRNTLRASLADSSLNDDYLRVRDATAAAIAATMAQLEAEGDQFGLLEDISSIEERWKGAIAADASGARPERTPYGPIAADFVDMASRLASDSNLILDPDAASYFVISCIAGSLPTAIENFGQVWGWSAYGQANGYLNSTGSRVLRDRSITASLRIEECRNALQRASAADPSLTPQQLQLSVLDDAQAYIDSAIAALKTPHSDNQPSLYDQGLEIEKAIFSFYREGLMVIEALLNQRQDADSWYRDSRLLIVAASLLLATWLFFAFYLVTRNGMAEVDRHLTAMKQGDLTTHLEPWGTDEAAGLMRSLKETQASIREIVNTVRTSSRLIVTTSAEIASASNELAQRTERTALNLQESATAVRQMSRGADQSAQGIRNTAAEAQGNAAVAADSGRIVNEVVQTMGRINDSSSHISQIITTIDSIAFQTNILALNASVEAARAGEQGRGFAVVASEVRQLAQRSADAAREIKTLIEESMSEVQAGTAVVGRAGDAMTELVATASRVDKLLSEVSTAVQEQASGVTQVDGMLNELDQMTQQNASMVQESAAAAAQLRDQSVELGRQVERFKLPA